MILIQLLFCLLCGAVLQALIPPWFWLGQAVAPVLLGLVVYYALAHDEFLMLIAAALAGVLQDALGMIPLGYSSFCFCVAGLIVSRFKETVFSGQWLTHMLFGALSSGGVSLALTLLLSHDGSLEIRPGWAILKTWGAALLGAAIIPLEFVLLARLDRMIGNVQERES